MWSGHLHLCLERIFNWPISGLKSCLGALNLQPLDVVSDLLDNPKCVVWSHSDRQADFYELPTDGEDIHEALGWLLEHYSAVKLWMGVETDEGAELYLTCSPSRSDDLVHRLTVYSTEGTMFERMANANRSEPPVTDQAVGV